MVFIAVVEYNVVVDWVHSDLILGATGVTVDIVDVDVDAVFVLIAKKFTKLKFEIDNLSYKFLFIN